MKSLILVLLLSFYALASKAFIPIHIDSLKVVQTNISEYYLAIYGIGVPGTPCPVITSAIAVSTDSIDVFVCCEAGSQNALCKATDSIYLGNLSGPNYVITLNIAIIGNLGSTCSTPWNRDTFQLNYTTVGIDEIGITGFTLSPNPTTSKLNLQITTTNLTYQILTTDGRVLLRNKTINQSNIEIDVSTLPAGIYFLLLQDEKQRVLRKFVKQ